MNIFVSGTFNDVHRIDFCCPSMATSVLTRQIRTNPWTDHDLHFFIQGKTDEDSVSVEHCPYCGEKITTVYINKPKKFRKNNDTA
jgi:hypothetical protein